MLLRIVGKYDYAQIHGSTLYELHFLNMLQLAVPHLPLPTKQHILNWVAGPEGLRVIDVCLQDKQLDSLKYR